MLDVMPTEMAKALYSEDLSLLGWPHAVSVRFLVTISGISATMRTKDLGDRQLHKASGGLQEVRIHGVASS